MYAGFWRRFFAFLIDAFIVFVIYILAFVGLVFAFMKGGSDYMRNMYFLAFYLFTFALNILYWTLFECSSWQATPGKKALGIKVTDMDGNKLNFAQSLGRNLGKIVSNFTFYIGYVMAGFTVRRQALHDKMAGCLVIDKNANPALLQPLPKASLFMIIVSITAVLLPLFLLVLVVLAAILIPSFMMLGSRIEASKALADMASVREMQRYYKSEKGVYASSMEELLDFKAESARPDFGPILKNNADFTYTFLPFGVSGKYNQSLGYTLTSCYDSDIECADVELTQFKKLKIAAPQECCIKEN